MGAPITPDDVKATLADPSADECTAVSKAFLEFPAKIWQFISWVLKANGDISDAFVKALGLVKPGDLIFSASPLDEVGRVLADGRVVSRTGIYTDLFAKLGVVYGAGDGSTTFQLPDYRDRFPVGAGSLYSLGATGGEATHVLSEAEMPPHTHTYNKVSSPGGDVGGGGSYALAGGQATGSKGSGQAHENRPPYAGVYIYLKL